MLILSSNIFGQNLRILNTKDLIGISEKYGLDSALTLTNGIPIFHIDETTTEQLINQIKYNKPSYKIEEFLVDYALCMNKTNLSDVIYDFFNRKKDEIKEYVPDAWGYFPNISIKTLFILLANSSKRTDSLLFSYYELWNEKSTHYKQNYERGLEEKNERKKERLMTSYQCCNNNCYTILLFLKQMNSPLYSKSKQKYHEKFLKPYWRSKFSEWKDEFAHNKDECSTYIQNNVCKTIQLTKEYNSIGDIDFNKEAELKIILDEYDVSQYNKSQYDEPHCWKFLVYNNKNGYLDLGCQLAPLAGSGVLYRLELKNDKLIIHELYTWIS